VGVVFFDEVAGELPPEGPDEPFHITILPGGTRSGPELTNAEVTRILSGKKVGCQHANCGKTFFVRRAELKIRREDN